MSLADWGTFLTQFGWPAATLLALVLGLHRGWIVMGTTHREQVGWLQTQLTKLETECTQWTDRTLHAQALTEAALASTTAVVDLLRDPPAALAARSRPPPGSRDGA